MNKVQIPYQATGYFSTLIGDYLDGKKELESFYNQKFTIESFEKVIQERVQLPIDRGVLNKALTRQCQNIELSDAVKTNIKNLKNDNCFTVTTGHQLNLFTGPLYFIYKIVSTINLAKELKTAYPNNDFVPVFWMATEDHDFEEVNHFNLFQKKYELAKTQTGAVGKMQLDGVDDLLAELKEDLGDRNGVEEILNLFSAYYSSDKTYTQAIRGLVNHLFGKYGLVIVDGDDAELKRLMVKEFEEELLTRKNHELINSTTENLVALGYKAQVTPREINLFYLTDQIRERIVLEEGFYKVLNTNLEFSKEAIIKELTSHPERFSPNAPLRPMYQEKILPNLAYIGGGGELAYWFQLKDMFDANHISFPILVLRNSVLIVDKGSSKKLQKLEIPVTDLFKETDVLIKEYLKKGADVILDLKKEEQLVVDVFEGIVKKAGAIDQSLQPFVKAELQKSIKSLKNIEGRLIKGEKKKEEVAVNQIQNIKEKLFPKNFLQERHDNIFSLLLFYGESIIEELMEQLHPIEQQFNLLEEEMG
ncbi:MAG: bacillithiol biosynthesis cysteine-adding enzyme BshC [Vicingus serpentipes]|nr:bacillithiol biosynthesis cysteine-adding enzyme BshC [Vicingus serpentipes]